ncbi:poly-beta-1,6 N-acetyl-D-glucosamine synthase [Stenotrophomonas panacihumi]|uniref:Poly-beta-1,6-N-acetyl-D-glucosamine synthase n=1 Tax=Stenotrophomonas panacihumi TaxID=676599 RepID=A0A0Q9ZX08_9GAMM|nr:poly-beta-1,6-N-acetyl-D-glucosamine synthase [Stenotrophomonas panacihumi]KRG37391.1 poly-beta-1,6 N-acetyl-D-glucosamine synthase [Stenotrophomonas panacihumi]PTN53458.1 poly-beta-1,6 N-acetyl-D-glucosamine synthase [Stenotrophomonas panacihumi]
MAFDFPYLTWLFNFAFFYPIVMAFFWMIGGVYYYWRRERRAPRPESPPPLAQAPFVSILVPCFNEADHIAETIAAAVAQDYPHFEVIAINDGSTDDTARVLEDLTAHHPRLRVVHLEHNHGKANALRVGTLASRSDYLVCVDADALLDVHATRWLVGHLVDGPRVGGVTGNPRVRNRTTLMGRMQVGEFSAIVGLIKRAQRVYGRLFTVSGVICAFRRSALHRVGFWADDMVTEDIDISWRLQLDGWDIRYEPNALCWILMPETFRGLWMQRLRWARGGVEVLLSHGRSALSWRRRRMWGVLLEYALSLLWAYAMLAIIVLWALGKFIALPPLLYVDTLLPRWHGLILAVVCLLQFATSLAIERRYERGLARQFYWVIWYPVAFWMIGMLTAVIALPRTLLARRRQRALWRSPDRGVR